MLSLSAPPRIWRLRTGVGLFVTNKFVVATDEELLVELEDELVVDEDDEDVDELEETEERDEEEEREDELELELLDDVVDDDELEGDTLDALDDEHAIPATVLAALFCIAVSLPLVDAERATVCGTRQLAGAVSVTGKFAPLPADNAASPHVTWPFRLALQNTLDRTRSKL